MLAASPVTALPLGVNVHIPSPELLDAAVEAGAGWVRIDLLWSLVEPEPDRFVWDVYDAVVEQASRRGLRIFATIASTPAWATAGSPGRGVPRDPADFQDVCLRAAGRYRGRVAAWGMWNEPNQARFFEGWIQDYIDRILRPGSAGIRAGDPGALVAGPELAHLQSRDWDFWLEAVVEQAADTLDVVTHHVYPSDSGDPAGVVEKLNVRSPYFWDPPPVGEVLRNAGWLPRPVWLTETGYDVTRPGWGSEPRQAAFISGILPRLLGPDSQVPWLDRVFVYELAGAEWGLLGPPPELVRRPAIEAYAAFAGSAELDDAEVVAATFPRRLAPGAEALAHVTLRNTGTTTWTTGSGYALSALPGSEQFAAGRQYLAPGQAIPPGGEVTLRIALSAPFASQPDGPARVEWRMLRGEQRFFGEVAKGAIVVSDAPEVRPARPTLRRR